ncbi:MAG: HAD family hydrolase [Succinivibrio sp.]|nr:HAD family hydrolase [Succinivibrio sp.]
MSLKPAVFLDRDGVINVDTAYVGSIEQFTLIEGAAAGLRILREKGYVLVLCTNQSGLARGFFELPDFIRVNDFMQQQLALHGAALDAVFFCPHHPQARVERYRCRCSCRKPGSGMFKAAIARLGLDPARSYCVGDRARDVQAGLGAAVARGVLVGGQGREEQKVLPQAEVFPSLLDFARAAEPLS